MYIHMIIDHYCNVPHVSLVVYDMIIPKVTVVVNIKRDEELSLGETRGDCMRNRTSWSFHQGCHNCNP